MPRLTGNEVTPDMCACRAALVAANVAVTPELTLAVWSWHAGLTTIFEALADFHAANVPTSARYALLNADITL